MSASLLKMKLALAFAGVAFLPGALRSLPAQTPPVALTTATTQDGTVSVSIPDGWKLTKGGNGFAHVVGPNDERLNLGTLIVAKNGPAFSTNVSGEVAFVLPFAASLKDKLATIIRQGAAKQRLPEPRIEFAQEIPTRLQVCSRFLGGWTAGSDSLKFEAIICSFQPDYLGLYKNLVFLVQVPSSRAAEDRPIVERIARSYRVTPDMFKRMLAPYTPLPPQPVAAPAFPTAPYQQPSHFAECFDYNTIRESPPWEMPMHCGGWQPY